MSVSAKTRAVSASTTSASSAHASCRSWCAHSGGCSGRSQPRSPHEQAMKAGVVAAAIFGLAIAVWLLFHVGAASVFAAIASVGLGGFALICLTGLGIVALMGSGWFALLPDHRPRNLVSCIIGRQTRDSAGDILPFSQFGGMVIGARALTLRGVPAPMAFASMAADVTTELMAQIAFIAIGIALCLTELRASATLAPYVDGLVLGTFLLVPGIAALVVLQKRGSALAE